MSDLADLISRVDVAFARTGAGLATWTDPHPDRSPVDDDYSRVTDAAKWRIVGARSDAWLDGLTESGLATVETGVNVSWSQPQGAAITRVDKAVPFAAGAVPLLIARGRIKSVDDAGITLGVGDPTMAVASIPDCGCDACDSGSQDALDELDEYMGAIVSGQYRRLERGDKSITVMPNSRGARNVGRRKVESALANPKRWHEVDGASWFGPDS